MANKKFLAGILALVLVFGMGVVGCGNSTSNADIIYIVTANGTADTETTTQLTFVFSSSVNGLTAKDITITAGTGSASKGALTGSGTNWNLSITAASTGTVKVKIVKTGIESSEKTVTVHKAVITPTPPTITYTVTANGTPDTDTTLIWFAFSSAVSALNAEDIIITAGTGSANKGTLTGSGGNRNLSITVETAGTVKIKIVRTSIESGEKTVTVYKSPAPPGSNQEQAILLSIAEWKDGSVASGEVKWYKFEAASGTSYRVQWKDNVDKPDSDNYTGDIKVTAYQSNGTTNISTINGSDSGWTYPSTVSGVSGTVYLKVEPYSSSAAGTYAIRFYNPVLEQAIPLSIAQWEDGSVTTGEAKWYKFEAASGTSYRVQWKDKNGKPDSDDYTAWVKVTAYQSDGTTMIINGATSGWTYPRTVSGVSGMVYLKVEPYSSSASYAGTYAIRFYDPAIMVPQVLMTISSVNATPVPAVVVTWDYVYSTSGVTGYRVYRSSTETGSYTQIGADITSYSTTSYTDTNVSAGNTYWYKVAAYNSVGEGDKSAAKQSGTVPVTSVGTSLTIGADLTVGTISTATQVDWYKFEAVSGTTYRVQWADYFDSSEGSFGSTYKTVVRVSAFKSDGTPITTIQNTTLGWTSPGTVSGVSGTVYIKVEAYINSITGNPYIGNYGIKVYQQ